ncbi:hypothetical protein ERO13_D04G096432v2 [Gossypium hirsutum]|nr:hypothetical protein ERO13_D04G096432v2 [Gossypium hirsutum]
MIESQRHSYHLVDPSPWPISGSLGALATTVGGVMYMHSFQGGARLLSLGLIFILYTMFDGGAIRTSIRFYSVYRIGGYVLFCFFWGFFSFFFGTYGRDWRYLAPKRDWGFRSLGNPFS